MYLVEDKVCKKSCDRNHLLSPTEILNSMALLGYVLGMHQLGHDTWEQSPLPLLHADGMFV